MIKYKYICLRFIIDKNVKIYKKEGSNKLYCKNKINTKNNKKICMISLNNYKKKRKKLMLLKHNKKQVAKQSSKKKTRTALQGPKKKRNIKGGGQTFKEEITDREISIIIEDDETREELGYFTLQINLIPYTLSINIAEHLRGRDYSTKLLKYFYKLVTRYQEEYDGSGNIVYKFPNGFPLKSSDILYIDTDVSQNGRSTSFWDHLGLKANRHYSRIIRQDSGYEKFITLKDLLTRAARLRPRKPKALFSRKAATLKARLTRRSTGS